MSLCYVWHPLRTLSLKSLEIFLYSLPLLRISSLQIVTSTKMSLLEGFSKEVTHWNCVGGELLIAFFVREILKWAILEKNGVLELGKNSNRIQECHLNLTGIPGGFLIVYLKSSRKDDAKRTFYITGRGIWMSRCRSWRSLWFRFFWYA